MSNQEIINYLKAMVIDAVHLAKSGHIGGAMSAMDMSYFLFTECLRYDPDDPVWPLRDRFILSAGHMSMILYSMHYAIGYLTEKDLREFRQLGSRTPGHPENSYPAIECTTGPLGQGAAMSAGFAIASLYHGETLAADIFDQQIVVLMGDGCMQEGITLATASYAGHLALSNLTWIYDKNAKQISGDTSRVTSDNYEQVFRGYGWQVLTIDGHDHQQIKNSLALIHIPRSQPLLIISNTVMGQGAHSVAGNHRYHGEPFPAEEIKLTKKKMQIPVDKEFYWPQAAQTFFRRNFPHLKSQVQEKNKKLETRKKHDREFASVLAAHFRKKIDFNSIPSIDWQQDMATRKSFGKILHHYTQYIPNLIGGSADLEPSNMTQAFNTHVTEFTRQNRKGRGLAFGVREFPMSAISNGIALFGGLIPFDATFLCFSDYSRPALRLGAIQKLRVIHEFTHDSVWLGEDGPTHQPVEHLMSLRAIPDFYVIRPADSLETEIMFRVAINLPYPSAFCLTRQDVTELSRTATQKADVAKGGYVIAEKINSNVLIIATGSEVALALQVAEHLAHNHSIISRIVSLPCWELFDQQPQSYRELVLPPQQKKLVSIEAGVGQGWEKYIGGKGLAISIECFGKSAKPNDLASHFGFTAATISTRIRDYLAIN